MQPLRKVERERWNNTPKGLLESWENDRFLVQINQEEKALRITINKKAHWKVKGQPIWKDGISWDEIQQIKSFVGFRDKWAVECYPPDDLVVNVANMRHIWLLETAPCYGWHKEQENDNI